MTTNGVVGKALEEKDRMHICFGHLMLLMGYILPYPNLKTEMDHYMFMLDVHQRIKENDSFSIERL